MALKTFTTGTVLTASDTNTYLTNGGLVYVTHQAVSGTPSSLTVSNCFNSTYDNYRIVFDQVTFSAGGFSYLFQVGGYNTLYYGVEVYDTYAGGGGTTRTNNGAALYFGVADTASNGCTFDVINPYLAKATIMQGLTFGAQYAGWSAGQHANAVSCTSFTLIAGSGTITGGSIYVYGYRKA